MALAQLRSGEVGEAVDWYAANGRIAVSPNQDTALQATVEAWAADVRVGANPAMYAWKRANVAELNRRGRMAWEELGRLSGPELVVGDVGYRAGDRIVTWPQGPEARSSPRSAGRRWPSMWPAGRWRPPWTTGACSASPKRTSADHLAHGYAVTAHRSQGATVRRA